MVGSIRKVFIGILTALLAACASYDGYPLVPGHSSLQDIEQLMGPPAMRWRDADKGEILVYPRGPSGYHTWMLRIDPAGRLISRENALEPANFARIQAGMDEQAVLRVLGPPIPAWTEYFQARDERVWEWRYCDDWGEAARFDVLFDGTSHRVRSTMAMTERQRGLTGDRRNWCNR